MMNFRISYVLIVIFVVAGTSITSAFAAPISIETDSDVYDHSSKITVTGQIANVDPNYLAVALKVLSPNGNIAGVAKPGTVKVTQKMEIEKYSHIMHIVSNVVGKLDKKYDQFDAMRAAFPAGTVSGAPKVRAMQLISELEPEKRGPYSGGVGYFSYNGNMDTCIAIRTLILKDKTVYLQAGGGIVADSIIENEYQETLHKMQALIGAIDDAERGIK